MNDTTNETATWNDLLRARWVGSAEAAVVTAEGSWDGDEMLARAGGAARWLEERGFAPGAAVPAVIDDSPSAVVLLAGAALSGRILAPLGTKLPPADLALAARGVAGAGIVATPETAERAGAAAVLAGVPLHVLAAPPEGAAVPMVDCRPDDVAVIVHTSGTTGAPKPVPMRHRQLVARIGIYADTLPMGPGDRFFSASPFHHTAGVTMTVTTLGLGVGVIPQPWFSIDGWRQAGRLGATIALLVPTMIDMLLAAGRLGEATPRVLQYGAAPIDPRTLSAALQTLPDTRFLQIFGQTEVSPLTKLTHEDHLRAIGGEPHLLYTVGRPVLDVELAIEEPEDGVGQVVIRSPHAFVTDRDGWRRTGDLGSVDSEGYLRLRGRLHDRIVRGGENVYPVEVEEALATHPGVREVAVVGVPDQRWGEIIKAVVVPRDDASPELIDELRAHARERLAHFKVPTVVELADALPRNANGKVLRQQLLD